MPGSLELAVETYMRTATSFHAQEGPEGPQFWRWLTHTRGAGLGLKVRGAGHKHSWIVQGLVRLASAGRYAHTRSETRNALKTENTRESSPAESENFIDAHTMPHESHVAKPHSIARRHRQPQYDCQCGRQRRPDYEDRPEPGQTHTSKRTSRRPKQKHTSNPDPT